MKTALAVSVYVLVLMIVETFDSDDFGKLLLVNSKNLPLRDSKFTLS